MKKSLAMAFLSAIVLLSLVACATGKPVISSQPLNDAGYSIRENTVFFEFHPEKYAWVTNGTTGKWVDISAVPIRSVSIAGDFNGWNVGATRMIFDGSAFYLPISRDVFTAGRVYQFKYVINGEWWVEPPKHTANVASTQLDNNGANLTLLVPAK